MASGAQLTLTALDDSSLDYPRVPYICLPPCAVSPLCRKLSEPTAVLSEECPNPWRKGPCQLCTERFLLHRPPLRFGCSVGVAREGAKPCLLVL